MALQRTKKRSFSREIFIFVAVAAAMIGLVIAEGLNPSEFNNEKWKNSNVADHEETDFLSPATLVQVHVITRHGARTSITKDADSLAEASGATLTPLGQQQLFDLGRWLQDNYVGILGGETDRSLEFYNPSLHRFESSNLDRTLISANSLALGLFSGDIRASSTYDMPPSDPAYKETVLYQSPLAPAIPVFTDGKDKNDVTLRAYMNCPTFHERLKRDLYPSADWQSLEVIFRDLLLKLGKAFPEYAVNGVIPLEDIWNVYDPIHVARTECRDENGNDSPCKAFVNHEHLASYLSDEEFERLETLTEEVEQLKFGPGADSDVRTRVPTAGNLLGSNLLWKILNRSKGDGQFFLYSAHAPTILGFLSTLQATKDFYKASGGEKFVDYGSALIVEIHKSQDKGVYYFVVKYKAQDESDAVHVILKESATGVLCGMDNSDMPNIPKSSWCTLDEVVTWAKLNTLTSERDWCAACNNHQADVCLKHGHGGSDSRSSKVATWMDQIETTGSFTGTPEANAMICLLFFGGFLAGIGLMGLVWFFSGKCCRSTASNPKLYEDDSTKSHSSNDGKEEPIVIEDMSSEQLNDKEIC